jgi:hypothetical protein
MTAIVACSTAAAKHLPQTGGTLHSQQMAKARLAVIRKSSFKALLFRFKRGLKRKVKNIFLLHFAFRYKVFV